LTDCHLRPTRSSSAPATVKTHVAGILAKLGLRNQAQAVVFAYESGVVRASAIS